MKEQNTVYGILAFVALVATQVSHAFDSDPATVINYGLIVSAGLVMLGFAKSQGTDAKKESE